MNVAKLWVLILTISASNVLSQTNSLHKGSYFPSVEHAEWFKDIPQINESTPEWAKVMYLESSNHNKIVKLYEEYYKAATFEKNIHTQNYKFWRRNVEQHVDENGIVKMPAPGVAFKNYESKKKKKATNNRSMTNTWTNLGPTDSYEGANSNPIPRQANVYCLGVAPSNPSIVYASAETGGIFKTIDKGLTWLPVSYDYSIGNMQDIKVDPLDPDIVYGTQNKELYKTTDGGTTWSLHYIASERIEQLYIHSTTTNVLYAATRDGVYKSEDSGATWVLKYSGYVYDIEAKPGNEQIFYISIKNDVTIRPEILKSTDSGETWSLMDNGFYSPSVLSEASVSGCKIGVTPADPNRIYAGIIADGKAGDNGWIGIYYSLDEGATWQEDSGFDGGPYASGNDMNTNWYVAGYSSGYHQGWYNFDIDVSHTDPDKLWIGTIWFCESGNKGANIEYIRGTRSLSMHADIQDIDVVGNDIWVASDGGINYSNDQCQTMETRMSGITAVDFWGFSQGWNEDVWTGGRYHNGNASYYQNYGDGEVVLLGGAEAPTGYVNPINNRLNYFSDSGGKKIPKTLSEETVGIANLSMFPNQSYFHFDYSEVEWHPYKSNVLFIGKDDKFYRSEDGGYTFDPLFTFPGQARRFEISRDDPDYIYMLVDVGTYDWRTFKSTDGGLSFTELPEPNLTGGSWRNLSMTLNPFDKNELWVASYNSSNGNKIFSSTDGGLSWTNHYSTIIEDENIKDMIYHASPGGDKIYTMTNDNFYYYDKDSDLWEEYSDGLPLSHRGFMILPFYRDQKIRMASAKGIWEIPFETDNAVQALPMAIKDSLYCNKDTVQFESYSIIDPTGATWDWSFNPAPMWIDDASSRNPKVVFGSNGNIDVTLTVTDVNGNSDSRTVVDMIKIQHQCEPDLIAGSALQTFNNGDRLLIPNANLENVTNFTVTGWWKPQGAQQAYAALVSSGDWCAHCDYTEGLIFNYGGNKLWYKWPGMADNWASNSGIDIPLDEWSYVALTIEPTKATLYLNDQKYVHNKALQAGNITDLYLGWGHYSKSFKGLIDEVTIWTKTLTEDEIYRLRHITKENEITTDPDLISYYQNNDLINESILLDHAGTRHGIMQGDAVLAESTVPVGTGTSQLMTLTPGTYNYDFNDLESNIVLNDCIDSEGKMVLTRIETDPDQNPNANASPSNYWLVNYYNGQQGGQIDELNLKVTDGAFIAGLNQINDAILHTRDENAEGTTWLSKSSSLNVLGNNIVFDRKININQSTQIGLSNLDPNLVEIDPGNPCEADTIAGNTLVLDGNNDYAEVPNLNLNTNTFTLSAWVKPNGLQNSWAGIVFCRGNGTTAGLSATDSNELRYHWDGGQYGWASGAFLPVDQWSHVALVIAPTNVTIYLNGVAYSRNTSHAIETFDHPTRIGNDSNSSSRTFNGEIDEVCIWDRSLDINDIRMLRHLTKDGIIPSDTNFKAYYQFNEDEGDVVYDRSSNNIHALLKGDATRTSSTAPVGGGESEQLNVSTSGIYNTAVGIDLEFNASGTYPDGELIVSRINVSPDTNPDVGESLEQYWVINNYGNNENFTSLETIKFHGLGDFIDMTTSANLNLFDREENDFGPLWNDVGSGIEIVETEEAVIYMAASINSFGQYIIEKSEGLFWIGVEDTDWDNPNNWGGGSIPGINDHVIIPTDVPHYPIVNINDVIILTLSVELGASLTVPNQFNFDVTIGN